MTRVRVLIAAVVLIPVMIVVVALHTCVPAAVVQEPERAPADLSRAMTFAPVPEARR